MEQIQSKVCVSIKDFTNNFKENLQIQKIHKLFSRANSRRILNSKKQMSSFINSCYRFRTISSRTIQNLKLFGDNQDNEEIENITLSYDSYVHPEFIQCGGPMVNLDKRFQESFIQLYICTFVSL